MGRFTIPEWLGISTGATVIIIVLMALFMFWGAEQLEKIFGSLDPSKAPKIRIASGAILLVSAIGLLIIGQPDVNDRWEWIAEEKETLLINRQIQIHPGELLEIMNNDQINTIVYDLRNESDFNLFHIKDVQLISIQELEKLSFYLKNVPENTVIVLLSNDEEEATAGWKILTAFGVLNLYLLEGGINNWLDIFGHEGHDLCKQNIQSDNDSLRHFFKSAIDDRHSASEPDIHLFDLEYTPKVKIKKRTVKQGGCG